MGSVDPRRWHLTHLASVLRGHITMLSTRREGDNKPFLHLIEAGNGSMWKMR
jgi:hypothetical protein